MAGPFDDPDVQRLMYDAGVVHKPGLAAELLQEIGPLLAEDGFDIDNLETTDLDTLNLALGRAIERRNFERFVPVGQTRAMALTALRLTAEAISENESALAKALIHSIQPEPDDGMPSIAQTIGVSLGVLDTWHTDPQLRHAVQRTRMPVWEKHARTAGTDILALARKGRAFDSISGLHAHHNGLTILHGSILAVTGTLQTWATHEHTTVRELSTRVLAADT
jgi:hypothetical protein